MTGALHDGWIDGDFGIHSTHQTRHHVLAAPDAATTSRRATPVAASSNSSPNAPNQAVIAPPMSS